jgi:hypothetical protein
MGELSPRMKASTSLIGAAAQLRRAALELECLSVTVMQDANRGESIREAWERYCAVTENVDSVFTYMEETTRVVLPEFNEEESRKSK